MKNTPKLSDEEKDEMVFMWLNLYCEKCELEFESVPEHLLGCEGEQQIDKWSQAATARALNAGWTWTSRDIGCPDCKKTRV